MEEEEVSIASKEKILWTLSQDKAEISLQNLPKDLLNMLKELRDTQYEVGKERTVGG